jgi:hypothetical protein
VMLELAQRTIEFGPERMLHHGAGVIDARSCLLAILGLEMTPRTGPVDGTTSRLGSRIIDTFAKGCGARVKRVKGSGGYAVRLTIPVKA